ncbi:MAG: hypothetical protein ABII74_04315 [Elusimicrobiota bacterium]
MQKPAADTFDDQRYQLVFSKREVMEVSFAESVRRRLNQWAKEFPEHQIEDFGEKIEVLSLVELPVYRAVLHTQYESRRRVGESRAPYRGEALSKTPAQKDNIDVWQYPSEEINDFRMQRGSYAIPDSRQAANCLRCLGQAEEVCDRCNGQLQISCEKCEGLGKIVCPECKGRGGIYCWNCGGRGKTGVSGSEIVCIECSGKGKSTCNNCKNGYLECVACKQGTVQCTKCLGKGILPCAECEGQGKIMNFLCFEAEFNAKFDVELIPPNNLPAEIALENFQEQAKAKKILETTVREFLLAGDSFKTLNYPEVKKAILLLIEKSRQTLQKDKQTRIIKQKLLLQKFSVFQLDYRYGEKKYQLWIYNDLKQVVAEDSPFLDVYRQLMFLAEEKFQQKKYLESLALLEKIIPLLPEAKSLIQKKINRIRKIIEREHICGALLAGAAGWFFYGLLNILIWGDINRYFYFPLFLILFFTLLFTGLIGWALGKYPFLNLETAAKRIKISALIALSATTVLYLLVFLVPGYNPLRKAVENNFRREYQRRFVKGLPQSPQMSDIKFLEQLIKKYEKTKVDLSGAKKDLGTLKLLFRSFSVRACNEDIKYYNWAVTAQKWSPGEQILYLDKIIKKYRPAGIDLSSLEREMERLKST